MFSNVKGGGLGKQEKTVAAGTEVIEVTPDTGKLLSKVTVNPTPSQSKTVTASTADKKVVPDSGKQLSDVDVKGFMPSNGTIKSGLKALSDITENDFVYLKEKGYDKTQVGQITPLDFYNDVISDFIKLSDNYYMLLGAGYVEAIFYDGNTLRSGPVLNIRFANGFIDTFVAAVGDPYQLGCAFCAGEYGEYVNYIVGYIGVDADTLTCTLSSSITCKQDRTYYGFIDFVDGNTIFFSDGNQKVGTAHIDRSDYSLSLISEISGDGGPGIKISDRKYLLWYSGGGANSWYFQIYEVNSDNTISAGKANLLSENSSGIPNGNAILKFPGSNNVYVPCGTYGRKYCKLTTSNDWITINQLQLGTGFTKWSYSDDFYKINYIDDNKAIMYDFKSPNAIRIFSIEETEDTLIISLDSEQSVDLSNDKMKSIPTVQVNEHIALACNGENICTVQFDSGYTKAVSGGMISGIAMNDVKCFDSNLSIVST